MSHTPGSWKTVEFSDGSMEVHADVERKNGKGDIICSMFGHFEDDKEVYPNARLISAAPDLLAALQDIARGPLQEPMPFDQYAKQVARDAIAKATGGKA